jgi:mitotic spindle assembly checkpoint protein MAD1
MASSSALTTSSSSRKRNLVLTSSTEPASQRARRDILSTQLETLQAELDHERSLRALDQKRFASTQQRLERQIQFAVEEAKEAKALMEELRQQSEEYSEQLKRKYQILQETYHDLQYRVDLEGAELPIEDERVEQLRQQVDLREEENLGLQETIAKLQQELEKVLKQKSIPPPSQENIVLQSSPAPPQVMKELNAARLQLQESDRQARQMQRANDKLQALNKELRLKHMEQSLASTRVTQLQDQLQERDQALALAQAQLTSWREFGMDLSQLLNGGVAKKKQRFVTTHAGVPPEIAVVQRYLQEATKETREQQAQNQALESQLEAADDKLQDLQRTIRELEQARASLGNQLKDAHKQAQVAERQVLMLQGQESVWKREIETLRSIVHAFDDLPLPGKTATPDASQAKLKMVQASLDAAQDELKVISKAKEDLQSELELALKAKSELQSTHNTVLEKFGKLRDAVYAERAKAEKAETRAVQAEELAGKGSFNPETTRVLHLQSNPLTESLKQEINVLRRQVEALTKTNKGAATTPGPDVDPNKLHQRLKESFKEQIGRFREGVYLLTGYKIDMIPDGERPKFKVRSMFAEQQEDQLLFQWPTVTPIESLDLLDTELAKVLMTTPSYEYVTRFGSLPAFLASTQLSLFEKQTMM